MPSQAEIRQSITQQIVAALKEGKTLPWRSPWVGELSVNPHFLGFEPAEKAIAATGADIRLGSEQAFDSGSSAESVGE
jgi:antirestriction protein ArdC